MNRVKTGETLLQQIVRESGQPVHLCFQCRKCSAGCPMVEEFDFPPNMVMRMIQLDRREELLASRAIWMCVSCEICGARCPNGIETAPVMDCLRAECLEAGVTPADKTTVDLHTSFADNVKIFGRLHEATMLMLFKLRDKHIAKDEVELGVKLFLRGKMPFLPKRSKNMQKIRELFEEAGR